MGIIMVYVALIEADGYIPCFLTCLFPCFIVDYVVILRRLTKM
nr:MAG TPA: hypothetical protein [Caudoviricetes sp.]